MASLESLVIKGVITAFKQAGDLAGNLTLRTVTNVFDPATSQTVTTNVDTIGQGLIDSSIVRYMDNTNLTNQYILLWLNISVEPDLSDLIVMPDGNTKTILAVNPIVTYNTNFIYEVRLVA